MKKELFDEINLKKMGEVLKYWRKKNNISLYDLSNTMQINYHALRNIEEGNQNVQLKIFLRYIWFIKWTNTQFDVMYVYEQWRSCVDTEYHPSELSEFQRDIFFVLNAKEPKGKNKKKIEWKMDFSE